MKKNNIFIHELNESIQANAALNCIKNRNNHKQINEVAPVVAAAGRMLLPMLRPIITKLVQKALVKIGTHARPTQVITHVMGMLTKGEFAKKMAEKCGQTWNEIPSEVKKEIQDAIIAAFKKQAPQEQEEDYTNDEIPSPKFSYRMSFMVWAMREIIPYLKEISQVCAQADPTELKHAVMKILKTRDTGVPETSRSCKEWAKENYDWVEMELNGEYDAYREKWSKPLNIPSEQEETTDEKAAFALKLVKKFKNRMTPDYAKRPEMYMMLKLQNALKKPLMSLSKEEYRAWARAICDACESVFGASQEQEETSDFDARFEFRKDLRELAAPAAKKAYMIIRKQYGDNMWRRLYMDDCDERGLIDMLNMYAEDGLNPKQIVNKMLGSSEEEETVDYAQLADDVCASYRGSLSKLDLKGRINYIVKMVAKKIGKTVDALTPQELTAIQKAAKHSVWYVSEQEESVADEKLAIAKQLMANYNPDTDELEDPTAWLLCAIQERIGKLFLKMPKKEVKAWKKAIDSAITEYEFEKQHPAHYEHPEDEARLQSQLADAWDEGMADDEDDYVPYENKFDETHRYVVDNLISAVEYYFDTDNDVNGFYHHDYTEAQLGKAVEKVLDKYGDFPSSNNFDKCYAWTKKHAEELMKILETGSLENPYQEHPEFDFSEQEENVYSDVLNKIINDGLDYWDVWAMAKQGKATKTELEISSILLDLFETLMYNGYGQILSKVASGEIDKRELKRIIVDILMEQDVDTFPRGESEYNSWVNEHNSEIVKRLEAKFNEEQEELPSMERRDMILALSEYMSESWIDTDDGSLDDIYYAIADILDRTGDYPASTDWKDCKPWCQKYYKEVEAKIY